LRIETRKLTLIAILASVYALGSFLPGFPMVGVPGSRIDIVRSLEAGYGLIIGPVIGPSTAFLGAIVGKTLTGGGFGLFLTPLAPLSAFIAASLSRKRIVKVRGWIISSAIFTALIAFWFISPPGQVSPLYPIPHLMGHGIILLFRGKISDYLASKEKSRITLGVALSSYASTMAGHLAGNLIFYYIIRPDPLIFIGLLPISIVERLVLTTLSTVIATPLILVTHTIFPELTRYR
jgi:hypothetical protein